MEIEFLVKKITAEIMSEFSGLKHTVMIFGKQNDDYTPPVDAIIKSGVRVLYLEDDWQTIPVDRYILPFLSLNQMGDLVHGTARGRVAVMVLETLLKGHTVEVAVFGYENYLETAPGSLIQLYDTQKQILAGFGIKPLEDRPDVIRFIRKSLITEKDIRGAADKGLGTLKVMKHACITPLAADQARENNIEILKQ